MSLFTRRESGGYFIIVLCQYSFVLTQYNLPVIICAYEKGG